MVTRTLALARHYCNGGATPRNVSSPPGGTRHWTGSGYSAYEHHAKKAPPKRG